MRNGGMKITRSIVAICLVVLPLVATAAPSGPKKSKEPKPEIVAYNEGVELLMNKDFSAAAARLSAALEVRERFPEAHNNLAYALRKQGSANHAKALDHYNRAIELNSKMSEAYMYRGVLHVTMGNLDAAKSDLTELERLRSPLAPELAHVIDSGAEKEPEQFFGVTGKL